MTVAAILCSPAATTFFGLTASLNPTSLSQTGTTSGITTSGTCLCTGSGGTPPYTYEWFADPENTDGITATAPNQATTAFKHLNSLSGETYSGSFFCTVTDALGAKGTTPVEVAVTITRS